MDTAAPQLVRNVPSWAHDSVLQVPVTDGSSLCSYLAMPGNTSDGDLWNPPDAETCKTCPPALPDPVLSFLGAFARRSLFNVLALRLLSGRHRGAKGFFEGRGRLAGLCKGPLQSRVRHAPGLLIHTNSDCPGTL
jgi:hypothetical protein